jgi:hypothetical protein
MVKNRGRSTLRIDKAGLAKLLQATSCVKGTVQREICWVEFDTSQLSLPSSIRDVFYEVKGRYPFK